MGIFSIYQNLKKDAHYKAATGLSLAEFDALFLVFADFYTPKLPPLVRWATIAGINRQTGGVIFHSILL